MDIRYKVRRIWRWSKQIGLLNALNFEMQQTFRRPVIAFRHKALNRLIYLRSSSSDIEVFEQVFIANEFDIALDSPALIVDGGANCGLSAVYFATRFPTSKILAVEPSAENCAICRRNTAGLDVEVIQTAIWSSSTRLKIENPTDQAWSFHCVEAAEDDPNGFAAVDMQSLLSGRRCDLVKLDIEGAEVEIFRHPDWLKDVSAIVVEIHSEEADGLIRTACHGWDIRRSGEKFLLTR